MSSCTSIHYTTSNTVLLQRQNPSFQMHWYNYWTKHWLILNFYYSNFLNIQQIDLQQLLPAFGVLAKWSQVSFFSCWAKSSGTCKSIEWCWLLYHRWELPNCKLLSKFIHKSNHDYLHPSPCISAFPAISHRLLPRPQTHTWLSASPDALEREVFQ